MARNILHSSVHERKKPYQCNNFDSSFTQNGQLKSQIASVHERKKPFQCNECASSFTGNTKLKGNIVSVHERKKPFQYNSKLWNCFLILPK